MKILKYHIYVFVNVVQEKLKKSSDIYVDSHQINVGAIHA